ncbi:AAA family ATPase [Desulfonatronum thioautotrophicum]|uniref:AAA family ATPase n=1 Tax=Desulfonatronum thioautotrophicum TaxID=617001 RepID=UPI0005EBD2A3|nr:MoxR family ATPase [Desulfonatronum thioautotrophicum]
MHPELQNVLTGISGHLLGKDREIKLALACLLAKGHLLIEDIPGVGKTTLAETMARVLGLKMQRIQFTSDLLPADILGISVYDRTNELFHFHPGPIFAQVILADEINRATPKTQSALLEAMEEGQVTMDGQTRALSVPFFVIATQNPLHQIGTYPLPESQLDRFLMRISLGYPDAATERDLLRIGDTRENLREAPVALQPERLQDLQGEAKNVHVSDALLDYVQALLLTSRRSTAFQTGLSPRAGRALLHAAQAWAFLEGLPMVLPEHVQAVLPAVVNHRLQSAFLPESGSLGLDGPSAETGTDPATILLRTPLPHP